MGCLVPTETATLISVEVERGTRANAELTSQEWRNEVSNVLDKLFEQDVPESDAYFLLRAGLGAVVGSPRVQWLDLDKWQMGKGDWKVPARWEKLDTFLRYLANQSWETAEFTTVPQHEFLAYEDVIGDDIPVGSVL